MSEVLISEKVADQLQRVAAQMGESPDALAEDAIRRFLRLKARQAMSRELQSYRVQHQKLLHLYRNRYIAMYQGEVVDNDADQLALLARIEDRYPDTPVLITQVLNEPDETYTVRSPRWVDEL